jgi:DNA-binding MarR family transcriptional regulator
MTSKFNLNANASLIAELMAQLGRIVYGDGFTEGLTPAQWTALRYFSRVNRFSCTISAFAQFHGTTRGTASQTVKTLVTQGYLQRSRCERDGRSTRLQLTDKGVALLSNDPFHTLIDAVRDLPADTRVSFAKTLEQLSGYVARERSRRPFGMCLACHYLQDEPYCKDNSGYYCGLMGESLQQTELASLCANFEPGPDCAMRNTLRRMATRSESV